MKLPLYIDFRYSSLCWGPHADLDMLFYTLKIRTNSHAFLSFQYMLNNLTYEKHIFGIPSGYHLNRYPEIGLCGHLIFSIWWQILTVGLHSIFSLHIQYNEYALDWGPPLICKIRTIEHACLSFEDILNNLTNIKYISFFQTLAIIFVFPLDKGMHKPQAERFVTGSLASRILYFLLWSSTCFDQ
jgi:hypothetical protein